MPLNSENHSRVLFWNIWGHRYPEELHEFLQSSVPEVDIFCFTEVTNVHASAVTSTGTSLKYGDNPNEKPQHINGFAQLEAVLGEQYESIYSSSRRSDWICEKFQHCFPQVGFGSALFFRRGLNVIAIGERLLCEDISGIKPRTVQWVVYEKDGVRYLVAHFHGVWIEENTKGDHPVRMIQSEEFLQILSDVEQDYLVDKVVFGGDFNLDINTQALKALQDHDSALGPYRNLIVENGVISTRSIRYRKYYWPGETLFADYVFAGANVSVYGFDVTMWVLASDHLPLVVTFQ